MQLVKGEVISSVKNYPPVLVIAFNHERELIECAITIKCLTSSIMRYEL
jgi:hypothetical protein